MNGANGANGEEWVILLAGGRMMIGRDVDPAISVRMRIAPVFDLNVQVQPVAGGQVNVSYQAVPIMLLPTLDALEFDRATTVTKRLSDLGPEDRRRLMGAVRSGQEIQTSMRAQTAGVALPRIVMPGGRQ